MIVNTMTDAELERELLPEFRHIVQKHKHETTKKWMVDISKRDIFPVILKKKYVSKKNNVFNYYGYFVNRRARKEGYMGICTTTMRTKKGVCTFWYVVDVENDRDFIVMIAPHAVNRMMQRAGVNTTHNDSTDEFVRQFADGCHGFEEEDGSIAYYFKIGALLGRSVTEHFKIAITFVHKEGLFNNQLSDYEDALKISEEIIKDFKEWHRKRYKGL